MEDINANIVEIRNNLESLIEINETMHDTRITAEIVRLRNLLKELEEKEK